jgi:hypothetical protein
VTFAPSTRVNRLAPLGPAADAVPAPRSEAARSAPVDSATRRASRRRERMGLEGVGTDCLPVALREHPARVRGLHAPTALAGTIARCAVGLCAVFDDRGARFHRVADDPDRRPVRVARDGGYDRLVPISTRARRAARALAVAAATVACAAAVVRRSLALRAPRALTRQAPQPLPNLFDQHPEARFAPRRELGLATIPVSRIRGTAVEGPTQRGRDFKPLPFLRGANWRARWQRLKAAGDRLAILPPIDVVETADGYWVVDGHNRVALALANGQADMDASVTHLRLPGEEAAEAPSASLESVLEDSQALRAVTHRPPDQ